MKMLRSHSIHVPKAVLLVLAGLKYVAGFVFVGTITGLVAAFVGMFFVFGLAGVAGIVAIVGIPFIPFLAIPFGFLWSMPLTFFLFPIWALCLRRQPVQLFVGLAILGFVGGGTIMWFVMESSKKFSGTDTAEAFVAAGAIAGLAASMVYGRIVHGIVR